MAGSAVDPDWLGERLGPPARALGVRLDPAALARLAAYATRLLEWGARINLTGARDAETLADEHLADVLPIVPQLPQAAVLLDVGSGAGLPGIPLALLRPDLDVWLLEPRERRHTFLRLALREAGLDSGQAVCARLEDWDLREDRPSVDVAISRAVWPPAEWLERGRSVVRPGGRVIAIEGRERLVELPPGARRLVYETPARAGSLIVWDVPA